MEDASDGQLQWEPEGASPGEGVPFQNLALRAEAFIAEQGGRVVEDLLVSHVFGSSGSTTLWKPLLRDILSKHEALVFRSDGTWVLSRESEADSASPIGDFVVLDVETTGLQASRQRIIEIAVASFSSVDSPSLWSSLCNPGRRVPAYIVKLTGIDNELLQDAPQFEAIADAVIERLGDAVIVGHNVEFDLAFLNEELKRIGRQSLVNERVDTLALATRLIPSMRKPTLQAVAQHVGLVTPSRARHRAGTDAMLTGSVAVELFQQAADAGYRTLDEIKGIGRPVTRRPRERMPRASSVVDRSMLASIPRSPGVYIMRDANERVVYVGKAKNLRDRVGSYFSQPLGYTRKMDGLIESLSRIQVEVVGSELEALLLESQLIRRYQPRYNTALRSHEQYPFIRVDVANAWPRVSLAKRRKDDGARYFGPFRSAATARKTVDLINRVVPLRTCTRSFRDARSYGSPCIQLDLGRCMGPCVGRADRDEYMALVHRVVDYVDGRDLALHELLWQGLEDAASALDFERASRLRRDVQAALSLTAAQRRLRESVESGWGLLVTTAPEVGCRELFIIAGGRIWSQTRASDAEPWACIASRLARSWERCEALGLHEPDHDSVDDMHILGSWLARHERYPGMIAFDRAAPDWPAIVSRAMGLRPDELDFDAWRKARDLDDGELDDVTTSTVVALGGGDDSGVGAG